MAWVCGFLNPLLIERSQASPRSREEVRHREGLVRRIKVAKELNTVKHAVLRR